MIVGHGHRQLERERSGVLRNQMHDELNLTVGSCEKPKPWIRLIVLAMGYLGHSTRLNAAYRDISTKRRLFAEARDDAAYASTVRYSYRTHEGKTIHAGV